MNESHQYVLIMAGGAGTRLWPISRSKRPKQFQAFTSEESLLQHMVQLCSSVIPMERTFIMATPEFAEVIKEQVPALPAENLLYEPARRDNGPAIFLGMEHIRNLDPKAQVAILWSDHLIQEPQAFEEALKACYQACTEFPDSLIVVGANPTHPDTGLGYIHMGKEVAQYGESSVFKVRQFIEKPDEATAIRFAKSWEYLWNVGYKVMGVQTFVDTLIGVRPDIAELLQKIQKAVANDDRKLIDELYEELPKESIEYLFTQHLEDILVVPADIGWSDVGNWNTLHDILKKQETAHFVSRGQVISIDSMNCLVMAKDRPIACVGIEDLIIVDDGDVLLVMAKDKAQDIKKLTKQLESIKEELL